MANLQRRLEAAEERLRKAEEAMTEHYQDQSTAVGVVLRQGAAEVLLFVCHDGPTDSDGLYPVQEILNNRPAWPSKEVDPNGPGDAGAILTSLLAHLAERQDHVVVVGRLPQTGSALLLDPDKETVALYRPDSEKPLRSWSYDGFLDAAGRYDRNGGEAAYLEAHERTLALVDLMEPGYAALSREQSKADHETVDASKALKGLARPKLKAVPSA